MKPYLNVVGAAIVENGRLFTVRRNYGVDEVVHKFEFVGGKINDGETGEEAIMRECAEELDMTVEVTGVAASVEYEYPEFYINLTIYFCRRLSDFSLKEHEEQLWIPVEELSPDGWAPADAEIVELIKSGVVTIREAKSDEDLRFFSEAGKKTCYDAYEGIYPDEKRLALSEKIFDMERLSFLAKKSGAVHKVILLNGEAAGFYSYQPPESGETGVFLSLLFISNKYRGMGLATRALNTLRRPVVLVVDNENADAVAFFKHMGFKVTGCVKLGPDDFYADGFNMELE
ncbi:MAG: GNAT family N-acetyltransferase [Clostridia bacterium]|nr:GNAT family N-acetyltransferase [Clostridia bacterium]